MQRVILESGFPDGRRATSRETNVTSRSRNIEVPPEVPTSLKDFSFFRLQKVTIFKACEMLRSCDPKIPIFASPKLREGYSSRRFSRLDSIREEDLPSRATLTSADVGNGVNAGIKIARTRRDARVVYLITSDLCEVLTVRTIRTFIRAPARPSYAPEGDSGFS